MSIVRDGIALVGCGLVAYGLWQVAPSLTYVFGGLTFIGLAVVWKLRAGRNPQ